MARKGSETAQVIRERAAEFFFNKGFDATTLREVASAAGLKVGSLYNHIESKEDLLLQVMGGVIDDLIEIQQEALAIQGDAVDRLCAVVECHVRFHAERAMEVYIGNTNLRSLSRGARETIIRKRNDYEAIIRSLIIEAGREGLASVIDARLHTYSIVASGTQVAGWYKPEGRMKLDDIVTAYTKFALRELRVEDADERVDALSSEQLAATP